MRGIFLEANKAGGIKGAYLVGNDEGDQAIAEYALCRLVKPRHWGWLRRLISPRPGLLDVPLTGREIICCPKCHMKFYEDSGHVCRNH